MKTVRCRGTSPLIRFFAGALAVVLASLVPVVPGVAGAQSIAQTKSEIAALSAQLARQQKSSEITANEYDAAKAQLASLTASIVTLQARERVERGVVATTTHHLVTAVVQSYVFGTSTSQAVALFNQNVNSAGARQVFDSLVVGDLNALRVKLDSQRAQLFTEIGQLATQRAHANTETTDLQNLLAQNIAAADQTRQTLPAVTSSLRSQIIAYEVAAGAAAARVRDTGAEASAVAAASSVGGQPAANLVIAAITANTPPVVTNLIAGSPAGSSAGEAAVAFAERQIGVPYVWGGETSGVGFDCSGLVQWAWAQAGYSMPRTTEEQWATLPHIALNQLQPGDLLYYYNLDGDNAVDHVVMYVGAGTWGSSTIIAAPYTGTTVSLAPMFTGGLVGAARP